MTNIRRSELNQLRGTVIFCFAFIIFMGCYMIPAKKITETPGVTSKKCLEAGCKLLEYKMSDTILVFCDCYNIKVQIKEDTLAKK